MHCIPVGHEMQWELSAVDDNETDESFPYSRQVYFTANMLSRHATEVL